MLPPGLLPDEPRPPSSSTPLAVGLILAVSALVACIAYLMMLRRDLDAARKESADLRRAVPSTNIAPSPPPPAILPPPPPAEPPAAASVESPPKPAPAIRTIPTTDPSAERVTQGLADFRAGRYGEAERSFFRALPDGYVYLSLAATAQRQWSEAFGFLSRAMAHDRNWLRKVRPQDLFGTAAEYEAAAQALEGHVRSRPLDAKAKLLLAFLHFHEKGPAYAQALLGEAEAVQPGLEETKAFLQALEP